MKKQNYNLLFTIFFLSFFSCISAQNNINSKKSVNFEELQHKIELISKDRNKAFILAKKYIVLAKEENNLDALFDGYTNAIIYSPEKIKKIYADSLIIIATKTKDNRYIGLAYSTMSEIELGNDEYASALDHAVIANEYLKNDESKEFAYDGLFRIAKIKRKIGDYSGAYQIIKEIYEYYKWKKEQKKTLEVKSYYLVNLNLLIKINASLNKSQENINLLKEGYEYIKNNPDISYYKSSLEGADGFNDFTQKKYSSALSKFQKSLSSFKDSDPHLQEKFYISMCYWKLGEAEKAIPYFEEIREDYHKSGRISMEYRPMFEFFIEYSKKNFPKEEQLKAVDELLKYDNTFRKEQKEITFKIHKDYDEKRLLEEKAEIENERRNERYGLGIAIFLGLTGLAGWQFTKRKIKNKQENATPESLNKNIDIKVAEAPGTYKNIEIKENDSEVNVSNSENPKSYDSIELNDNNTEKIEELDEVPIVVYSPNNLKKDQEIDYSEYSPISKYTVKQILKKLDDFEKKNKFLAPNLTLVPLAEQMNTNDKYLSKVIRVKTGKNFNAYINDLRFEHIEQKMRENINFKNQKVAEISKYLGFGSADFFSTAFGAKYGITPKEFFINLEKELKDKKD